MNIDMHITGSADNGVYSVSCSCRDFWGGNTDKDDCGVYCPALAVAECAAHFLMCHSGNELQVRWSHSFSTWLKDYWERQALLLANSLEDRG